MLLNCMSICHMYIKLKVAKLKVAKVAKKLV